METFLKGKRTFQYLGLHRVLDLTPKARPIKGKSDKLNLVRIKNVCCKRGWMTSPRGGRRYLQTTHPPEDWYLPHSTLTNDPIRTGKSHEQIFHRRGNTHRNENTERCSTWLAIKEVPIKSQCDIATQLSDGLKKGDQCWGVTENLDHSLGCGNEGGWASWTVWRLRTQETAVATPPPSPGNLPPRNALVPTQTSTQILTAPL